MSHLLHRLKMSCFVSLKSTSRLMPGCIYSTANANVHLACEENRFMSTHLAVPNALCDILRRKFCGLGKNKKQMWVCICAMLLKCIFYSKQSSPDYAASVIIALCSSECFIFPPTQMLATVVWTTKKNVFTLHIKLCFTLKKQVGLASSLLI